MTPETQILKELVEAVSTPDWWMIALTIINIGAFVSVAYTQIRLQRQQTKAQEYVLYIHLYKIVRNLDRLIKEHIETCLFYYGPYRNTAFNPFAEKHSELSKCIKEFEDSWIDFELKFPWGKEVVERYRSVASEMQRTYHILNNRAIFEKENGCDFRKIWVRCQRIDIENDYKLKDVLISLLRERSIKKSMDEQLSNFLKDKEYLEKCNFSEKIAEHCRPERVLV